MYLNRNALALAALVQAASYASSAILIPEVPPAPGNGRTHGNGSKPIPGGGTRERARRLAQMEAKRLKDKQVSV